jgi:hypothetical protein
MVKILTLNVKLNVAKLIAQALQIRDGGGSALKILTDPTKLTYEFA